MLCWIIEMRKRRWGFSYGNGHRKSGAGSQQSFYRGTLPEKETSEKAGFGEIRFCSVSLFLKIAEGREGNLLC